MVYKIHGYHSNFHAKIANFSGIARFCKNCIIPYLKCPIFALWLIAMFFHGCHAKFGFLNGDERRGFHPHD